MKVVDLFCGCGGFSLGFDHAGFKIIYALDNWKTACESYQVNFPSVEVVCEDALNLSPDDIPDADIIDVVFPAVLATEWKGSAGPRQMARLSWAFGRKSLIPEAKLVQTFPLDYYLAGTLKEQYEQIGNAVPPLMAYKFAQAIKLREEGKIKTLHSHF